MLLLSPFKQVDDGRGHRRNKYSCLEIHSIFKFLQIVSLGYSILIFAMGYSIQVTAISYPGIQCTMLSYSIPWDSVYKFLFLQYTSSCPGIQYQVPTLGYSIKFLFWDKYQLSVPAIYKSLPWTTVIQIQVLNMVMKFTPLREHEDLTDPQVERPECLSKSRTVCQPDPISAPVRPR